MEDLNRVAEIVESNAIIANAEAKFGRIDALEFLDMARVGERQTLDSSGDTQASSAVQLPHVNLGLVREDNFLQEGSLWSMISCMVKPSSVTTCSKGIPLLCLNHSREASIHHASERGVASMWRQ